MNSPRETLHGVIAICSRGLVHSRTMQAVTDFLEMWDGWKVRYTHDEPIPEAQNFIVRSILISPAVEWIWFIEEDNVPSADFLNRTTDDPVQCLDYNLVGGNRSVHQDESGRVLFCGLGCTLVAADVFRRLPYPWFTTNCFTIERDGHKQLLKPTAEQKQYGGQDISFCYSLQQADLPIHLIPSIEAQHLRVSRMGTPGVNNGCHEVQVL